MQQTKYCKLVNKYKPQEERLFNMAKAFLIGGVLGIIGHSLWQLYCVVLAMGEKEAAIVTTITLIFIASLLTGLGFFDSWVKFARAGLIIPITGFAHAMTSTALEHKQEGFVTGIGSNIFKLSGSVILYGVLSAYVFGLIRLLIFGG
ncbi:MAG: SpoVA/SpoVAEb family sporulation membrane protein [Bacilli bacterium]|jgi:stage V sporulation protein AC|nr:SpoVA/SpoVAEb family sporulation membrane protein [Bacilli bacterium]